MPTYRLKINRIVTIYEDGVIQITADNPAEAKKLALQTTSANQLSTKQQDLSPMLIDENYGVVRVFTEEDQSDYIGHCGVRCPVCDGVHLTHHNLTSHGPVDVESKVICSDCKSSWKNIYALSKFEDVKEPTHA